MSVVVVGFRERQNSVFVRWRPGDRIQECVVSRQVALPPPLGLLPVKRHVKDLFTGYHNYLLMSG